MGNKSSKSQTQSQSHPSSSIDLSVFNDNEQQQPPSSCKDFKSCISTNRLLSSLHYYSLLNITSNTNHQNIFTHFMHEIYNPQLVIMDYYHVQKSHGHQVYDIMNHAFDHHQFKPCDLDTCPHSSRLYRTTDAAAIINTSDPSLTTICDIFDGIHHYIYHLFESGFRSIKDDNTTTYSDDDNKEAKDKYYDVKFAEMRKRISSTRSKTQRFNRIAPGNKFNIKIGNEGI